MQETRAPRPLALPPKVASTLPSLAMIITPVLLIPAIRVRVVFIPRSVATTATRAQRIPVTRPPDANTSILRALAMTITRVPLIPAAPLQDVSSLLFPASHPTSVIQPLAVLLVAAN